MRLPLHPHRAQSRLKPGELLRIVLIPLRSNGLSTHTFQSVKALWQGLRSERGTCMQGPLPRSLSLKVLHQERCFFVPENETVYGRLVSKPSR